MPYILVRIGAPYEGGWSILFHLPRNMAPSLNPRFLNIFFNFLIIFKIQIISRFSFWYNLIYILINKLLFSISYLYYCYAIECTIGKIFYLQYYKLSSSLWILKILIFENFVLQKILFKKLCLKTYREFDLHIFLFFLFRYDAVIIKQPSSYSFEKKFHQLASVNSQSSLP